MKPLAFPAASRITEKGGFNKVFDKPAYSKRTPFFSVLAGLGNQTQARLGIVVAKRNVKQAVARNRLKRIVRESFRLQQQQLNGLDVVVVIKKNFMFSETQAADLAWVFKHVGDKHLACCKS